MNKTTVFVCGKRPYQDNHEIIYGICKQGYISFIAKGIKKPTAKNKVCCEIGSFITVELSNAKLPTLINVTLESSMLLNGYEELLIIQLICELCCKFEYANFQVIEFLKLLSGYHKLFYFLHHLCIDIGLKMNINQCVRCQKAVNFMGISIEDGGIICQDCFKFKDILLTSDEIINFRVMDRVKHETLLKYQQLPITYPVCAVYLTLIQNTFNLKLYMKKYLEEENHYDRK